MGYAPYKLPGAQSSSIWKEKDIITRSLPSSTLEDSKTYRTFCRFTFGKTSRESIFMPDNHELLWALGMGYGRIMNWTPLQKRQCVTWIICTPASGGWLRRGRESQANVGRTWWNARAKPQRACSRKIGRDKLTGNQAYKFRQAIYIYLSWIRERPITVQMQDGNKVDYPNVISTWLPMRQLRCYRAPRTSNRHGFRI